MPRQNKILFIPHILKRSAGFVFLFVFFCLAVLQPCRAEDKFGIGQFSANPQSFSPHKGETTAISGVVYYLSPEANFPEPSITIKINEQLSLPVEVNLLSSEQLAEDSSALLSEWSFSAAWNGKYERGELVSPGEYTYIISLDLPNVGKDTKSGTITLNDSE